MIKAISTNKKGEQLIIIGLSEGNIENLKLKMPIIINCKELDPKSNLTLCIRYGKTEDELVKEIQAESNVKDILDKR